MAASIDAKMKACMTPHALSHILTGAGVGLLLGGLVPSLATVGIGVVVVVIGIAIDFAVNKG